MFGLKTLSSGFEVLFLHLDTHNRKKPCFLTDVDFLSLLKLWIYLYLIYAIKVQVLEVFPLIQRMFSSCSCICAMKIKIKRPYIFSSLIWTVYIQQGGKALISRCCSAAAGGVYSGALINPCLGTSPFMEMLWGWKDLRGFEQWWIEWAGPG